MSVLGHKQGFELAVPALGQVINVQWSISINVQTHKRFIVKCFLKSKSKSSRYRLTVHVSPGKIHDIMSNQEIYRKLSKNQQIPISR